MKTVRNWKFGGTLIEVMMACVVLTAIVFAGGAYVSNAMGILAVHRDRAVAVAMANSRMEELRSMTFGAITGQMVSAGANWFKRNGSGWTVTSSSNTTYDTFSLGAVSSRLWTGVQFTNVVVANDAIIMTVQATCRDPNSVIVQTIYSPVDSGIQ